MLKAVASCCDTGSLAPRTLGRLVLTTLTLLVSGIIYAGESTDSVSFVNDVVPVLTKAGCNTGVCHAKAGGGQNGFQLSLLGFEPQEDYDHLVREGRGRRLFRAAPDKSLLLQKAAGILPHGGGVRLEPDSHQFDLLRRWIASGTPYRSPSDPELESIEVVPAESLMQQREQQQLEVRAHYSDDSTRDVTQLALYETSDSAMAGVTETGLVTAHDLPGMSAIMVRYQGKVAVHTLAIPLGQPVAEHPPVKNFIDQLVFDNLQRLGIPPSPLCDDPTFLRRVTLDIAGRLPTLEETERFLASDDPDRRDAAVERLLESPAYADYFANKWTTLLKNRRDDASDITANFAFHAWVRDSLLANKPYDQFVRELLAATGTILGNPPVAWYKRVKEPKNQIEDVAQLFLGVRMQCAQCHHHPFERWSQDDYYGLVAFFSQVGRKPTATRGEDLIFHQRGDAAAQNVRTGVMVAPAALGDDVGKIAADEDPRLRLADWMRSEDNPFFAKALVNRYWKHFFSRGLIEPEDDIRDTNPPTNPELLAALERHFIESGFDLKALVRVITQSSAYQLSSIPNDDNGEDRQNYSRYYPKRLPAEVLLDSIDQVCETETSFANLPAGTRAVALPDNSYNRASPFLTVFGRPENTSVCECERSATASLAQSLHMINARDLKAKLSAANGRAAKLAKDDRPAEQRVRDVYLAAFAREPRADELQTALDYLVQSVTTVDDKPNQASALDQQKLEDLLWAVINSREFLFNH